MLIRPSDECLIKNNNDEKHLKWLLYAKCTHFIIPINYNISEDWTIIIPILQIKKGKLRASFHSLFFFFLINLFIYFRCVGSLLLHHGLSLVAVSGGYFSLRCTGFSLRWLLLLRSTGARAVGTWAAVVVARGLSGCGSWALVCRPISCGARA